MIRRSLGLRSARKPRAPSLDQLRAVLGSTPRGFADLSEYAGEIVDQNGVGHCTTSVVKAACTSLAAAGHPIGEPSHVVAYQLALRLDRAREYPYVAAKDLPALRDQGSSIATMVDVITRYGIAPYRHDVVVDGYARASDCGPGNATDIRALSFGDVIRASRRVVIGPYEIDYVRRDRDVQLALDAGYAIVEGGWVDTRYMVRDASSAPAGAQDMADLDGGGHAQMIVGYRMASTGPEYLIQGSWGMPWGDGGRTWVTSDYLATRWAVYAIRAELVVS